MIGMLFSTTHILHKQQQAVMSMHMEDQVSHWLPADTIGCGPVQAWPGHCASSPTAELPGQCLLLALFYEHHFYTRLYRSSWCH